jgi:hypothetical protein
MLEQELKEIWKNSSRTEKIKFETSRLMIDLNNRMSRIERSIRKRDIIEITTAILMIPVFGYFAYEIPFVVTKAGCILTMIWFGYLIFKLKDVKKHKLPINLALSFREQLANQKAYLIQEARLIDNVFYWYLLPPFVAHVIVVLGLGDPAEYGWSNIIANEILPIPLINKVVYLIFAAVLYAGILWINKRTVKKTYKPVIKEIERVQQQLESEQ